jgi:hypothetical protein
MAIYTPKYEMVYGNISGDTFRLELSIKGSYFGSLIPMVGYCTLKKKSVNDYFTAIRGGSLDIFFDADMEQQFDEFNIIQEFQFLAKFYRNGLEIFRGWINPDGIFQDYVTDKWQVNLTALDGLGFLKNYEFQSNDVLPQEANFLAEILNRLDLGLNFALFDDINNLFNSLGTPTSIDFINQNRRVLNDVVFRNKNGRFLDCEKILKDILQKYNFILSQENVNGQLVWLVVRTPFLGVATNQKGVVLSYDGTWNILSYFNPTRSFVVDDINSGTIAHDAIHCGKNQQITYDPALQNFRFTQKWLGLRNFGLDDFNGSTYDTFSPFGSIVSGKIVIVRGLTSNLAAEQTEPVQMQLTNPSNIKLVVKVAFDVTTFIPSDEYTGANIKIRVRAENTDGSIVYLGQDNGVTVWKTSNTTFKCPDVQFNGLGEYLQNIEIETPEINNVEVFIDFYTAEAFSGLLNFTYSISGVEVYYSDPLLGNGEYHDSTRTNIVSSFLKDPVIVINSNENNDVFLNNLYKVVEGIRTPQNSWTKGNDTPTYEDLLNLTSRERIDMTQRPQMRFRGDIFGHVDYWKVLSYDKINGTFMIVDYTYKTKDNIISLEAQQFFTGSVAKVYEKSYIFEDERNVLIR